MGWVSCEVWTGVVNWSKPEKAVYGMLHPLADVDRRYLPRNSGSCGLIRLEECVRHEEIGLAYYIQNSTETLLKSVERKGELKKKNFEDYKQTKRRRRLERLRSGRPSSFMARYCAKQKRQR